MHSCKLHVIIRITHTPNPRLVQRLRTYIILIYKFTSIWVLLMVARALNSKQKGR